MRLILLVIVVGLLAGRMVGGSLERVPRAAVRWPWAAAVGLALQLLPVPGRPALWLLYGSLFLLLAFAAANLRRSGFALILVGLALNLTVIAANGGMPVDRRAIVASGQQDTLAGLIRDGDGVKHRLPGPHTRLLPLGDVIAVPPPVGQVISVGDVVVDLGIIWFLAVAMRDGPRRRRLLSRPADAGEAS
ncbi:MAG TPA: DUF5317 family protein [Actinomycetes bacterium]